MEKTTLKTKIIRTQNGKSAISDKKLPEHPSLIDAERIHPKKRGGMLTETNTICVLPEERGWIY